VSGEPSSASERIRTPVSIRPPCSRSAEASASAIDCEPPRATGQPTLWQALVSAIPTAALTGRVSGLKEWAEVPPNSARVAGDFQRRAMRVAGAAAGIPKRASRSGCFGRCRIGRSPSSLISSKCAAGDSNSCRQARPSSPSPAAVCSIERTIVAALPSSNGWARSTSGWHHSSPCRSSPSERKKGDAAAIGCPAEQTS
jgi:hypothetical protein